MNTERQAHFESKYNDLLSSQSVDAVKVKDMLVECYVLSHGDDIIGESIVKKQFIDAGADYDNPCRDDLLDVAGRLKKVTSGFKDTSKVEENFLKIRKLIDKCDC